MPDLDLPALRATAEKAAAHYEAEGWDEIEDPHLYEFVSAASPATVLSLLDEIDRLKLDNTELSRHGLHVNDQLAAENATLRARIEELEKDNQMLRRTPRIWHDFNNPNHFSWLLKDMPIVVADMDATGPIIKAKIAEAVRVKWKEDEALA
jgi:hypothetical protein